MPGVRTHDFLTVATAAGANIAYFTATPHPSLTLVALFTGTYLFAGFACAGDLDLNSKEYRRWGPFRFLWWPYRQLIPHRSRLSHGLIVGGVLRIVYLATVCTLLFWLGLRLYGLYVPTALNANATTRAEWLSLFTFCHAHPKETFAGLSGFILAGTTHSLADLLSTGIKRRL